MSEIPTILPVRYVLEVNPQSIDSPLEQKAVLAMQASALRGSEVFVEANDRLIAVADQLRLAPTLTYEDLVHRNPIDDGPYVMTSDPETAEHEGRFYLATRNIEQGLEAAIGALTIGEPEAAGSHLVQINRHAGGLFRNLSPKAFANFSEYFDGLNGHPGASGLFSASFPILDLLSNGGQNIDETERARILTDIDRGLYPSHQTTQLRELLLSDGHVIDMPVSVEAEISGLLNTFRAVHLKMYNKFLPEGDAGSGGVENVEPYLRSKMVKEKTYLENVALESLQPATV